jgi:flap endonuclease-1
MGFNIKELVEETSKVITIENLHGRTIAVDAFNNLYQFLFAIKDKGGNLFKNNKGEITSHLSGLFYRVVNLIKSDIIPIYCFDGREKEEKIRWNKVKMKVRLTDKMVERSKELLSLMGVNYIQSPSEGEAQCVHLCSKGEAWGTSSQDFDVLLYGGLRLIRNLTTSGKKEIEYINLEKFLEHHDLTDKQLIDISILIGNDFFSGLKGVGIKTAYSLIKKHGSIYDLQDVKLVSKDGIIFSEEGFRETTDKIRDIFLNPVVNKDYSIKRRLPKFDKLEEFLIEENNFSETRVNNSLQALKKKFFTPTQKSLIDF